MTNGDKILRQTFLSGTPLSKQTERLLQGKESKIGFVFTLPIEPFKEVTLDIKQLRLVVARWEERRLTKKIPAQNPNLIFQKQWCEQSQYHYSLRIVPSIEYTSEDE